MNAFDLFVNKNLKQHCYIFVVILDTNVWYHSTKIVGNEMSITIGSEYD